MTERQILEQLIIGVREIVNLPHDDNSATERLTIKEHLLNIVSAAEEDLADIPPNYMEY